MQDPLSSVAAAIDPVDSARSQFLREARKLAHKMPILQEVAQSYPPRQIAWAFPAAAPKESAVAGQVALMTDFTAGAVSASDFARSWYDLRRKSMAQGERVRERFQTILDEVFYDLELYPIDPELREEGDLSDAELCARVTAALEALRSLDPQ